ncbi:hypothetical protein JOC55_001698 [Paenibacillus sacheonensis]|nr:hypothetical protein [Paenibacillus sacheonensis]
MTNVERETYEDAVMKLKTHARVALHFHPDRPDAAMRSIAEALLENGTYKSQFETFISNGSVSAYPGGERDLWEKNLFGGAYQIDGATDNERPKYGALDVMLHPDGPAPRFGSCYFLLYPEVSRRCTYTYLDSHQDPKDKGTLEEFDLVIAALMRDAFVSECALGERNLTAGSLVRHLLVNLELPFQDPSQEQPCRNLNHYIEAQVHGDISLQEDVSMLVADPSFQGTHVGEILEQLCLKYAIDLYWHRGFSLSAEQVPADFRGPSMPSLAQRIAQGGWIDASMIGAAAMDLKRHPHAWSDRGTYQEVLQELKLMWHVLVKYG